MTEPKQATAAQVSSLIRRKLRKREEHAEEGINIYPMMDMMTILLVFLIMQFAQDTANVMQTDDLQLPYSISRQELTEALSVQITRADILVDNNRVMGLRNGIVDPSQKQGGANGFLITPLHAMMIQQRDRLKLIASRNPNRPFRGAVQIIADKRTPFRTLSEVIYTLGQAEFTELHFVVLQGGHAAGASATPTPASQ